MQEVTKQKMMLSIEDKKLWLYRYLEKHRVPFVDDREVLVVNRENLVQESYDAF
jgi:hypothetical protein